VVVFEKRCHRIFDDNHVVAAISRVARSRFDAHIGGHSRDDQSIDLQISQEAIGYRPASSRRTASAFSASLSGSRMML
jgi:hypothetical protein